MLLAEAGDVTLRLTTWASIIIGAGALATALTGITVFVKKVLIPGGEAISVAVNSMRVMKDIAESFGIDGHETLTAELRALAANDEVSAENQQEMLNRLQALDQKLSETRHRVIGEFSALKLGGETTVTLVEGLERTAAQLLETQAQLRLLKDELDARHPEEP